MTKVLALGANNQTTEIEVSGGGGGGSATYRKLATFTESGTFTLPATALPAVEYIVRGGGGGGGAATGGVTSRGGGGGGGGFELGNATLSPGASYAVLVGAGGSSVVGADGVPGGDSSIAGVVVAYGGAGGVGAHVNNASGRGGVSGNGVRYLVANITDAAYAPFPSSGGVNGANQQTASPAPTSTGECVGGQGGASGGILSSEVPPGAGKGGDATASNPANGGHAARVGCGGGGAAGATGTTNAVGGNGFRGQVDIIYYDTVL